MRQAHDLGPTPRTKIPGCALVQLIPRQEVPLLIRQRIIRARWEVRKVGRERAGLLPARRLAVACVRVQRERGARDLEGGPGATVAGGRDGNEIVRGHGRAGCVRG